MNESINPITGDEVDQITRLAEMLENSSFDYLQVQVGDMKVTLAKGVQAGEMPSPPVSMPSPATASPSTPPPPPQPAATPESPEMPVGTPAATATPAPADDGTLEVRAPMLGRYYAQSQPGAPPFVTVGTEVTEDTTVGLIEVMKTFTTVRAGLRGVVTEILVKNDDYVEYGQPIMKVRPA